MLEKPKLLKVFLHNTAVTNITVDMTDAQGISFNN